VAEKLLQEVLRLDPNDALATLYLERTRRFAVSPPGTDWDSVFKLDEK